MIIKTIETFKTIKMSTDNSVIPDLVMVLMVLMVLTVLLSQPLSYYLKHRLGELLDA